MGMVGLACCGAAAAHGAGPTISDQPHVKVRALADRTAIAPARPFRVAVEFALDRKWHLYWITAGDPGAPAMPTNLVLKAPAGFKVVGPQFPPPSRHKTIEGDTFILEGKPVVLFELTPPAALPPGDITLEIEASWLVCEKSCLPGDGVMQLKLPVAKSENESKPANTEMFSAAVEALPLPMAKASYVKLTADSGVKLIAAGQKAEARLSIEIKPKHHIQSHTPPGDSLIATDVFLELVDGIEFEKSQFPPGKDRDDKLFGKVSEYAGKVDVRIPLTATKEFKPGPRQLRGVLQYQACTDSGTCYPPEYVAFAIELDGGAKAAAASIQAPTVADGSRDVEAPVAAVAATSAPPSTAAPARSGSWVESLTMVQNALARLGFFGYLVMAFLGGLILNVMPCVLPVISLKVLSFVRQAQEDRLRIFLLGLVFAAGIVTSFLILGGLAFSADFVWGGLFQRPEFSIVLAAVVTAFALSLFGVFHIGPPRAVEQFGAEVSGEGPGSAFMMGLLATILGTACTAPFLSTVVAFAVQKPPVLGMTIFLAAGLGMSSPYLLLTANPGWLRFVPRAGPWMATFEQVMGFLLLGTVIWLVNPLPAQITGFGLVLALIFITAAAFAAWLFGRVEFGAETGKKIRYYSAAAAVVALGWLLPFRWMATIPALQIAAEQQARAVAIVNSGRLDPTPGGATGELNLDWSNGIPWQLYDPHEAESLVLAGRTVFVDYTAEWCASCKTNEATSLNIPDTQKLMRELDVVPYRADFTNKNAQIQADFARLGRAGVPIYVIYKPGDFKQPIILPELLTPGIVADGLRAAGPSRSRDAAASVVQR